MQDTVQQYTYLSCWQHAQSKFKYEKICVKIEESWKRKKNDNIDTTIQQKRKKKQTDQDDARKCGLKKNNDDLLDLDLQTVTELLKYCQLSVSARHRRWRWVWG